MYLFVYMLAIAGKTAGPNNLTFVEGTHGCKGSNIGKKAAFFQINKKYFFYRQRLVLYKS